MAKIYYENSADLALIRAKRVAVFGYGSQGHAHALNLRDSGVEVRIALESQSRSRKRAQEARFEVLAPKEAALWVAVMIEDEACGLFRGGGVARLGEGAAAVGEGANHQGVPAR